MAARIKGRTYDPQPATLDQLRERMDEFPLAYSGPLFGIQRYETDPETGNITGNSPAFDDFMSAWKETYIDNTPPEEDKVADSPLGKFLTDRERCLVDYIPEYQGIYVGRELVHVPTKQCALVQHKAVFKPVVDALAALGVEDVKVEMRSTQTTAYMYVILPEQFVIKNPAIESDWRGDHPGHGPSKEKGGIDVGFYAKNSFDGSGAMEVGFFGSVQVCENGLIASRTMGAIRVRHTAGAPEVMIADFIRGFGEKITNLQEEISIAQQVGITREQAEAYFRSFFGKKALAKIMRIWDERKEENAWGLHSAITEVVTHDRTNPDSFHTELGLAENILVNPAHAVELANGLIIQFREDDAKSAAEKEAARAARELAHAEKLERKAAERAQKARESLMTQDNAPPEVDFSQADPLPPVIDPDGIGEVTHLAEAAEQMPPMEEHRIADEDVVPETGVVRDEESSKKKHKKGRK